MTLKELYETIKQKKENAELDKERESRRLLASMNKLIGSETSIEILNMRKVDKLQGEVDAYTDVLCLIESSGVLDDK